MDKVVRKQENSRDCLVCGMKNDLGLKAFTYETDNQETVALFTPRSEHQSYPGRLHGGIAAAVLDEVIGRAIMIRNGSVFGVTVSLNLEYRKPVPLDEELRVVGRITKDSSRLFEGSGELLLPNGDVAVSATGKYMKMPLDRITGDSFDEEHWHVVPDAADPDFL